MPRNEREEMERNLAEWDMKVGLGDGAPDETIVTYLLSRGWTKAGVRVEDVVLIVREKCTELSEMWSIIRDIRALTESEGGDAHGGEQRHAAPDVTKGEELATEVDGAEGNVHSPWGIKYSADVGSQPSPIDEEFEYIRQTYAVPARRGRRIKMQGRPGVIVGAGGPYVKVRFDDDNPMYEPRNCHPTWEMEYLDTDSPTPPVVQDAGKEKDILQRLSARCSCKHLEDLSWKPCTFCDAGGEIVRLRQQIKAIRERVKELKTDNDERAERWERRGEEKMGQFSLCRSSECEIILAAIDEITGVSDE